MTTANIKPEMSIEDLGQELSGYINAHWESVLEENGDELKALFPEYEDATYGMYLDKLIPPIWQEMEKNGFQSAEDAIENDFVIGGCLNFSNSVEKAKWGTPDHEIRVFWIVIQNQQKIKIGTLLFEFSHSHVQFDLPVPPKITAFPGVERREITAKILQLKESTL